MTVPAFLALTDDQVVTELSTLTAAQIAERYLRVPDNELALARALKAMAAKIAELD